MKRRGTSQDWDFEQEELNNEIINLRFALSNSKFYTIQNERQCQILTNLGCLFSYIGRFVEAEEYWNRALEIIPHFPMALCNKGTGLLFYGRVLQDKEHKALFYHFSYQHLIEGLKLKKYMEKEAISFFSSVVSEIQAKVNSDILNGKYELNSVSLGVEEAEKQYRSWCLNNYLFLNPINDIGMFKIAGHDCFSLPNILMRVGEQPIFHAFYNQMKQEFASARFLLYEGICKKELHFSDRNVSLSDTHELLAYSINLEKVKIAYKMSYSIFDKAAYFLNEYLKLNIPERQVSFKKIWNNNDGTLRNNFIENNNWALRGLYWLSKDLFEKKELFQSCIEPDGRELADIRNYLEHKFIKFRQYKISEENLLFLKDKISFIISREDFEKKTIKLMKLARATLIYLSIAVHHEESKKDRPGLKILPTMPLSEYNEKYKV